MKKLSGWLYRISTGWLTLLGLIVFLLFSAIVLPRQAAQAEANSGGSGSPDASFFYSAEDLYKFAEAYGPEGRAAYIQARFSFDVIWPLVYAFFLATAISWVYARAFPAGSPWRVANLAPLLGLLFDYLENLSTSLVMWRYPAQTVIVDFLAPIFTLIKWIFVNGSFLLLGLGIIVGIWRWLKNRGKHDG